MFVHRNRVLSTVAMLVLIPLGAASFSKAGAADFTPDDHHPLHRVAENDATIAETIRLAVEAGAITVSQAKSVAIREMFSREGFVIRGEIHPPPGKYRDDYSKLKCDGNDRRHLWLFFHWFGHIWQSKHQEKTAYSLGKAVMEHEQLGDRVYRYERPPTRPLLSYRYEQQAAIMADYGLIRRCGDPNGWLPQYERTVKKGLR